MISCRKQALREGNHQGRWAHLNQVHGNVDKLAQDCANGGGPNARAIPARWRPVFIKAFKTAARPNRRRKATRHTSTYQDP